MIVGIKDSFKMLGIVVVSACAVFVCTLFLNYNLDLKGIEALIDTEAMKALYQAQVMTGKVVCALSGGCLLLTSVILLCFYVKHYIDAHRKELGIIKAIGYSELRIAGSFWVFGLGILLGTAIGYAGAHGIMPAFYYMQNKDKLLPEVEMHFHLILAFCLIILPTLFFAFLSVIYSYRELKKPVLELLRGKSRQKIKECGDQNNTEMPFLKELRKNTVRQRKSLVFFIAFAVFCYAAMIQMSCSMEELSSVMMSVMIMFIGIVLAVVILFLAVTTIVRSNMKSIAMMRVFGYSAPECAGAVLNGYRPAAYIGFALGTVYQYAILRVMVSVVFRNVADVPAYRFDVPVCVLTFLSFIVLYELLMYCYTRRFNKISVKEIMLDTD